MDEKAIKARDQYWTLAREASKQYSAEFDALQDYFNEQYLEGKLSLRKAENDRIEPGVASSFGITDFMKSFSSLKGGLTPEGLSAEKRTDETAQPSLLEAKITEMNIWRKIARILQWTTYGIVGSGVIGFVYQERLFTYQGAVAALGGAALAGSVNRLRHYYRERLALLRSGRHELPRNWKRDLMLSYVGLGVAAITAGVLAYRSAQWLMNPPGTGTFKIMSTQEMEEFMQGTGNRQEDVQNDATDAGESTSSQVP